MSKLTRAWVEAQIENELERGNHPEAVRDLAALITVHKHLCKDDVCAVPAVQKKTHEHHPDMAVHHEHPVHESLDKDTVVAWVASMVDDDGVRGGKYSWHQAQQYARNKGITDEERMLEMYAIMNAMYADYHHVAKKFGVDRDEFYACMAKAWLEDADAVPDKAAQYYAHVVNHE